MLDFITVVKTDIDRHTLVSNIDNCKMSISLRRDGLSLYIINTNSGDNYGVIELTSVVDVFGLENIDAVLEALIKDIPELLNVDKELFVLNNLFTFVPEVFYDETKIVDIINFTIGDIDDGYCYDVDCVGDRYTLFLYPVSIVQSFIRVFGDMKVSHASTLAIRRCRNEDVGYNMSVIINESELEILLYKDRGFQFYNTFTYSTEADVLYYVMSVVNHFGIDIDAMQMQLAGNKCCDFDEILKRYFNV